MEISDKGLVFLAAKEGIVVAPYRDVVGVWTWGVGHTLHDGFNPKAMARAMPANIDAVVTEALKVFRGDLVRYEKAVNEAVNVPVSQHEFDALVSFHYNTGGIYKAKLTRLLNRGDHKGAGPAFMGWSKPAAIIPRRKAERSLFESGNYGQMKVPVYGTDGAGNLGVVIDTLSGAEILERSGYASPVKKVNWLAALVAAILKLFGGKK